MFEITSDRPTRKRIPKGWTEKLLCKNCEQHIGRFDDYAAKFFGTSAGWDAVDIKDLRFFAIEKYDYQLLKLFFLSLLWRSAITCIPAFEAVFFSSVYHEELRQMIRNDDPGEEHAYATVIFKYKPHKNGYEKVTFSPHRIRHSGCVTYFQLQLNEFPCRMKVSSQRDSDRYKDFWLSKNGPLRVMEVPLTPARFNAMVRMVQTQPKLLEEFRKNHEIERARKQN